MCNIIFLPVHDPKAKLVHLCAKAESCLKKQEKLLILVPDQTVHNFIDELLWRLPPSSFLPHPSSYLQIAQEIGEADTVFNLAPAALLKTHNISKIFEFEDHTTKERLQLSKQKYEAYRDAHFPISIES